MTQQKGEHRRTDGAIELTIALVQDIETEHTIVALFSPDGRMFTALPYQATRFGTQMIKAGLRASKLTAGGGQA